MLTRIRIRNFKRFEDVEFELGQNVVLIGPNNSGKTTALQALALWHTAVRSWVEIEKNHGTDIYSIFINVKDITHTPTRFADDLWNRLEIEDPSGRSRKNRRINISVYGMSRRRGWECCFDFEYENQASISVIRRSADGKEDNEPLILSEACKEDLAFLPAMSGMTNEEPEWKPGRINALIGQGQTAQVLRNLYLRIYENDRGAWEKISKHVEVLFRIKLAEPQRNDALGTVTMGYFDQGAHLDLMAAGRGCQQTLLLLAHMYGNPGSVLLLDEPDAHLEILRQREIYRLLTDVARELGCQIIAASHSEVLLQEAAQRDMVIAFVGNRPHRVDDRGVQVTKALREYGHEHYYLAELKGFVLYLEGATDLSILQSFANTLDHPARDILMDPYVHYVANDTAAVRKHFEALKAAKPDLVGFALFDRFEKDLHKSLGGMAIQWKRREIENYLCSRDVLLAYAEGEPSDDLLERAEAQKRRDAMTAVIDELSGALRILGKDPWSPDIKATDEFLDRLFDLYFQRLGLPNLMRKTNYHVLASLVRREDIDPEVTEKLDALLSAAQRATPRID